MYTFDVTCGIPRSGRTFENFFNKLEALGICRDDEITTLIDTVRKGKITKTASLNDAIAYYKEELDKSPHIGIFVDRKREDRPYRLGFLGMDCQVGDISVRIEGDEPHNCSSLVSLGEVDIALAGLDELLTVTQSSLSNPQSVKKWGMYNYHLPKERKVRIIGSAMLTRWNPFVEREIQDIVGFFLISKQKPGKQNGNSAREYISHLENYRDKVFVKGRYADMIRQAYPTLNIEPVYDVENAVMESSDIGLGLEIVQTGSTLKEKGLNILGSPLFLSETLYVVDYYKYLSNEKLREFIKKLKPVGYFDEERLIQFACWFNALEENLGENWVSKPNIADLFCNYKVNEPAMGLRPTRPETRYWMPHDTYKRSVAEEVVQKSIESLIDIYNDIKCGRYKYG